MELWNTLGGGKTQESGKAECDRIAGRWTQMNGRVTERQTDRWKEGWKEGQTDRKKDRKKDGQKDGKTEHIAQV